LIHFTVNLSQKPFLPTAFHVLKTFQSSFCMWWKIPSWQRRCFD